MIFKLGNSIKKADYHKTKLACYMGFITQAIAANFAPLLFLKFHSDYHISLGNIALISTFFFFTQLLVDLFCAKFVDHIGYRVCIVTSEIFSALGLLGLAFLPDFLPDPFILSTYKQRYNYDNWQPKVEETQHLWKLSLPDLGSGVHRLTVVATDVDGKQYVGYKLIKIE